MSSERPDVGDDALANLTHLSASVDSDITQLAKFTGLVSLDLGGVKWVSDFTPLLGLSGFDDVTCGGRTNAPGASCAAVV